MKEMNEQDFDNEKDDWQDEIRASDIPDLTPQGILIISSFLLFLFIFCLFFLTNIIYFFKT